MPGAELLSGVLRRDRAIAIAGLAVVALLAWAYVLSGAGMEHHRMDGTGLPSRLAWTPGYFALMFAMWSVMMAAMMLPAAAPMILLHQTISRRRDHGVGRTGLFALGYLVAWTGFSALATLLQWRLAHGALLSPTMDATSRGMAGALLVAAGAYQWTPLKHACLRHCRSPLEFVLHHWREGRWGSFAMGLRHGTFCLGCCAFLMLLLFVGGVMNLAWIALLAVYVLLEKAAPAGHLIARVAGVGLIAWGAAILLRAFFAS